MPKFQKGHKINLGRVPWNKIKHERQPYLILPPREEIIWAAGFWEGEGSLSSNSFTASQVNAWPLERLKMFFGGSIGQRLANRKNQQACFQWFICGEQARMFCALIYPYLSPRRRLQIDSKFITEEKRKRKKQSQKKVRHDLASLRARNEKGQFNHAKILRENTEEAVRIQ